MLDDENMLVVSAGLMPGKQFSQSLDIHRISLQVHCNIVTS